MAEGLGAEAAARATAVDLLTSAVDAEAGGAFTPCTRPTLNILLLHRACA